LRVGTTTENFRLEAMAVSVRLCDVDAGVCSDEKVVALGDMGNCMSYLFLCSYLNRMFVIKFSKLLTIYNLEPAIVKPVLKSLITRQREGSTFSAESAQNGEFTAHLYSPHTSCSSNRQAPANVWNVPRRSLLLRLGGTMHLLEDSPKGEFLISQTVLRYASIEMDLN
jgi:hypothetical protein